VADPLEYLALPRSVLLEGAGQEVSCRTFHVLLSRLEQEGKSASFLAAGTGYDMVHLRDKHRRISWAAFRRLLRNAVEHGVVDDPFELGETFLSGPWARPFALIIEAFVDEAEVYQWIAEPKTGSIHQLVSCVDAETAVLAPGHVRVSLRMSPGYEPSSILWRAAGGSLASIPQVFGSAPARVEIDDRGNHAIFEIRFRARPRRLARLRQWLRWPFSARSAAKELREAYFVLQARYSELQRQNDELAATEAALRDSEESYRSLVETAPEAIVMVDPETFEITDTNDAASRLFGRPRGDIVGKPWVAFSAKEEGDADQLSERARDLVDHALVVDPQIFDWHFVRENGQVFTGEVRMAAVVSGGTILVRISIVDISERENLLAQLKSSRDFLYRIINTVPDPIFVKDERHRFIALNDAFCELVGASREELLFRTDHDFFRDEEADQFKRIDDEVLSSGEPLEIEERITTLSGEERLISTKKARHRLGDGEKIIVGTIRDLTERRRVEHRLQQAQKLESLGVLAGGVAHDFNNLLVAILGQASLARQRLGREHAATGNLDKLITAATRASDLTRQMLAYSGRGQFERQELDLNEIVNENLHLLRASVPKHVELESDLATGTGTFEGDVGQIQQIVMNLIINGAEAVGDRPGRVKLRTTIRELARPDLEPFERWTGASMSPGKYVCLDVADTGTGMDPETLSRIFDPFFTTKFTGRGLGLAAVLGIVRGHGGGLRVSSTPDRGTTFVVALPSVAAAANQRLAIAEFEPAHEQMGKVLVIDDEQVVRETVCDILDLHEIEVLTAADGASGLEVAGIHRDEIALVVLDLSMPGMSGEETLQRLRELDPKLPVLLSSGYSADEAAERFSAVGANGFLKKPYSARALVEAVRGHARDSLSRSA